MIVFIAYSNLAAVGIRGHDTRGSFSGNGKKYRDSKTLLKIEQRKQDPVQPEKGTQPNYWLSATEKSISVKLHSLF